MSRFVESEMRDLGTLSEGWVKDARGPEAILLEQEQVERLYTVAHQMGEYIRSVLFQVYWAPGGWWAEDMELGQKVISSTLNEMRRRLE